jgi:hypothetical protein
LATREIVSELHKQRRPPPISVTVTIRAGESMSEPFQLTERRDVVGLVFPDRLDRCVISFQWSADGVTYNDAYDGADEIVLDVGEPTGQSSFMRASKMDGSSCAAAVVRSKLFKQKRGRSQHY